MTLPASLDRLLAAVLEAEYVCQVKIGDLTHDQRKLAVEESAHLVGFEGGELHPLFPQLAAAFDISEDVWQANFEQGRIDADL
jgi:hypothetical protein